MRIRTIGAALGALTLIAGLGAAAYLHDPLPARPDPAPFIAAAAAFDVEIIRDRWGIPHIYGTRDADTAFGLGYAQSEDDYATLQTIIAATRGRLARYDGAGAAPADYLVALLGVWDTIARHYATDLDPHTRDVAEAYAAGVNLYAAQNPDVVWPGILPVTGQDVIAGFVFKTPLFYGLEGTFLELFTGKSDRALALAPSQGARLFHVGPKPMAETGSNAMAVAPPRSGDGMTRLLVNSHQPFTGPVAWYEVRLHSEEGLDVYGGTFPGGPVIFHGINPDLGWANTVNNPDLVDVYRLTHDPKDDRRYMLDGVSTPFETTMVDIAVRLWGPFVYHAKREVLRSVHGPVIKTDRGAFAVRYAGQDEYRHLQQYLALNKARTFEAWQAAMAIQALPSINYIYADKTGTVAFVHNGQYPLRKEGWDWSKDLPGDRSDLVWRGYHPFTDVPQLVAPASGLVYNANNSPFSATSGDDNIDPSTVPLTFGLQTNETNRSLRLEELTRDGAPIGHERLLEIKFDNAYSPRSEAAGVVKAVLAQDWSAQPDMAAAAAHLAAWDFTTDKSSRHAALGVYTVVETITSRFTGKPAPTPEAAFRAAVAALTEHFGRIDPEWGEVNRIMRGDVDLPVSGAPDVLRAIYPGGFRDDGRFEAAAGDTMIIIAAWNTDGAIAAQTVHQYGSATLDEASPHYADQVPLFAEHKFRPVVFDREAVLAEASRHYRPGAP